MEPAHHDLDSEVSSIAESIRSDYSLQPDMAGPPQPNAESGSSRTKEQEARLEIPSSSRQQQPTTQSTLNNERDRTASEDTPLLGAELPPTYSDAIAAGASAGDPRDAWRRNIRRGRLDMTTFSRLQWSPEAGDEEEEDDSVNPLLSRSVLEQQRQPESMGGTPATDREERHRRDGSSRSRRRHRKRTKFRKAVKILCALIGVIAAIVILASLLIRTNSTDKSKSPNNDSKSPGAPTTTTPSVPTIPTSRVPVPAHPDHPQDSIDRSACADARWMETHAYGFDKISDLRIIDESESWTSAGGQFRVEPAPSDQGPDIMVTVSHRISYPWKIEEPNVVPFDDGLRVERPDITQPEMLSGSSYSTRACYETYIVVKIKEHSTFANLAFSTDILDVELSAFLKDIEVSNSTVVSTSSGHIHAFGLSGRRTYLRSHSGAISGSYALLDLLHVRSTSGSVVINVDPQKVSTSEPAPAELDIGTTSGSIRVSMPTAGRIPARDYISKIYSTSGSIEGKYLFSSLMYAESKSGSHGMTLLPYLTKEVEQQQIRTVSLGSMDIEILEPCYATSSDALGQENDIIEQTRSDYLSNLASVHRTTSGSIKLVYPDSWNGRLSASSTSGSIHIRGSGMHQIEGSDGWFNKHERWERGNGDGSIDIASTSGSIAFDIGSPVNTLCAAAGKRGVGPEEMILWLLGRGKLERIEGVWCFVCAS